MRLPDQAEQGRAVDAVSIVAVAGRRLVVARAPTRSCGCIDERRGTVRRRGPGPRPILSADLGGCIEAAGNALRSPEGARRISLRHV
jgi:hypothetical protein